MKKTFKDLIELSARLMGPGGCPWDKEQTLDNLKGYILEEAYEVIVAIENRDLLELREELGDLLYQVVFAAQILADQGHFGAEDVVDDLHRKLVRRHPHVFGDKVAKDSAEALRIWQGQKKEEKNRKRSIVEIPRSMPALARAQRVGDKASHVGFDWNNSSQVLEKVKEELAELEAALEADRERGDESVVEAELGDLFFSTVNLARFLKLDAETAAHKATEGFIKRFVRVEDKAAEKGLHLSEMTLEQMDELWDEVKREEAVK